jgi:spore germination protein KB
MEKAKVSTTQMFFLMILFELGSAILIGPGLKAEKDAWLAILLGLIPGIGMFLIYSFLFRQFPELPLTGYLKQILGKYIGFLLGFLYILYFIYIASRVLRDFGELLVSSIMINSPLLVINGMLILTIAYVLYQGFEVFTRTGEIFFFVLIVLGIIANIFVYSSGLIEIKNLLPVLENGWKPVLSAAFPLTFTFPFGEMVVFTMLLPYLVHANKAMRTGVLAMLISGVILIFTVSGIIAILGADIASRTTFPLLETIAQVNIEEFIQRLDILVVLSLIIGGFFKVGVFFYAAVVGTADLFKVDKNKSIVFPLGFIILISSMIIASNFTEHLQEGLRSVPYYIHLPFQVVIPVFLLMVTLLRKLYLKNRKV